MPYDHQIADQERVEKVLTWVLTFLVIVVVSFVVSFLAVVLFPPTKSKPSVTFVENKSTGFASYEGEIRFVINGTTVYSAPRSAVCGELKMGE